MDTADADQRHEARARAGRLHDGDVLFERIRADVVALVVLVVLGVTGLIAPDEIFGGFSGNAVMSIIATTILGAGLDRTGALNRLAAWLLRRGHGVEQRLLMMTTAIAGLNSSFMQNPSVMALICRSPRDGSAHRADAWSLAADLGGDRDGRCADHGRHSPPILLNDLLASANNNLPSGLATIELLRMFRAAADWRGTDRLAAVLPLLRRPQADRGRNWSTTAHHPRTESYFARPMASKAMCLELVVSAESPLVGAPWARPRTCTTPRCCWP